MKNFSFQRFQSLIKYDIVENGKVYAQAICIAFLIFFFIMGFVYYINSPVGKFSAQGYIEVSGLAAVCVCAVFYIMATSHLIVNRYCEARTGIMFNMLPATYIEKGSLVLLQMFLFSFVVPIIFYIISYTVIYLVMMVLGFGETIAYAPRLNVFSVYSKLYQSIEEARWFFIIGYTLLPVTCIISSLIYHIIVTFFRNKRVQIKAMFTYFVFHNLVGWIITICGFTLASLAEAGYFDWFDDLMRNHPAYFFNTLIALLLCQIPLCAALLWWFFKRLHYKEIR